MDTLQRRRETVFLNDEHNKIKQIPDGADDTYSSRRSGSESTRQHFEAALEDTRPRDRGDSRDCCYCRGKIFDTYV